MKTIIWGEKKKIRFFSKFSKCHQCLKTFQNPEILSLVFHKIFQYMHHSPFLPHKHSSEGAGKVHLFESEFQISNADQNIFWSQVFHAHAIRQ